MTNELMTDQGIDMRKIVKLAYTGASMTVEMQNYMSAVFASDLAAYATQTNMRSGGTVTAVLSDGKETPRELTSADQIAKNLGISDTASTGAGTSAGDGEVVFKSVLERLVDIFKNLRSVIYVLGGFGLIGFAFAAIFNKLSWSWFAAVAIALLTLGLAGAVVDYVTQTTQSTAFEAGELGDTLSGKKE